MNADPNFWVADASRIGEVAAGAALLFVFTVLFVRFLGKRATAQMNNFDWLIAVATGSLLASGILLREISLMGAIVAITVLGLCQFAVTKVFARWSKVEGQFKARPRLLVHKGYFLRDAMQEERITEAEIYARLRQDGIVDIAGANWVIIEADGQLSVIKRQRVDLNDVPGLDEVTCDDEAIERIEREHAEDIKRAEERFAPASS